MHIEIPVSVGELVDRITILRLKQARIRDREKLVNVSSELSQLEEIFERKVRPLAEAETGFRALHAVNERLWRIEDDLRSMERTGEFGPDFIEAARRVYRLNDERYRLKRSISEEHGSEVREEKSYGADLAE